MMFLSLVARPTAPDSLASRVGWRAEVCPPSLRQAPRSAWGRLWFWLLAPGALQASPSLDKLPPVRQDFLDGLADMHDAAARALRVRITQSRTLRELWHLRSELYRVVALGHSQCEAERRLSALNCHFPTRAPRSGFAPLLP
jgi:hypothetical protein